MDFPSWAFVGNEVICIREFKNYRIYPPNSKVSNSDLPVLKQKYIIKSIHLSKIFNIHMLEVNNLPYLYCIGCFAPLIKQTKENDITLFNKLINNIKSPELA